MELLLLARGPPAARVPVGVPAARRERARRPRGRRGALPGLRARLGEPRHARARRRAVPQRPRDRGRRRITSRRTRAPRWARSRPSSTRRRSTSAGSTCARPESGIVGRLDAADPSCHVRRSRRSAGGHTEAVCASCQAACSAQAAPRGGARPRPHAAADEGADAASGAARLVLAVHAHEEEDAEPGDAGDDEGDPARPADRRSRRRRCRARSRSPTAATSCCATWRGRGASTRVAILDGDGSRHRRDTRRTRAKKFTEPVALSSPEPVGFPLPRTAPGLGFDLLALRARCKRDTRRPARALARASQEEKGAICVNFTKVAIELALRALCSKEVGTMDSPSRWRFRPPNRLAFRFRVRPLGSASTYSRSVLGAGRNLLPAGAARSTLDATKRPLFAWLGGRSRASSRRGRGRATRAGAEKRSHDLT